MNEVKSSMNRDDKVEVPKWIPLIMWPEYFPWPSISSLRFLVNNAYQKNFRDVFKKVNGRILIDSKAFWDWADKQDQSNRQHETVPDNN